MKSKRFEFIFSFFLLGFLAQVSQMLALGRLWVSFYGQELFLTLALAIWLLSSAMGGLVGTLLARKMKGIPFLLGGILFLFFLLLFLTPWFIYESPFLFQVPKGQPLTLKALFWVSLATLGSIGFLLATIYPLLLRSYELPSQKASKAYAMEAIGALAGGMGYSFLLLYQGILFSFSLFVLFILLFLLYATSGKSQKILLAFLPLSFSAFYFLPRLENSWEKKRWENYFQRDLKFQFSKSTPYGYITCFKNNRHHYLYYNGLPYLLFPNRDDSIQRLHLLLNQHPHPQKVLFLGASPQGISEILHYPLQKIDYVFLDSDLFQTLLPFLDSKDKKALQSPKIALSFQDGLAFLLQSQETYDAIFLDSPPPSTFSANRYYTLEFFQKVRSHLAPKGLFVLTLESAYSLQGNSPRGRLNQLIYRTLGRVFQNIKILPGDRNLLICTHYGSTTTLDPEILAKRISSYPLSPYFQKKLYDSYGRRQFSKAFLYTFFESFFENLLAPRHIKETLLAYRGKYQKKNQNTSYSLLPWQQKQAKEKELEELYHVPKVSPSLPINRSSTSLAPLYYLLSWNSEMEKGIWKVFLNTLLKKERRGILFFLAFLFVLPMFFLAFRKHRRKTLLMATMFWVAFSAMVLEFLLFIAFQSHRGYLYFALGAFLGLFMFSLSIGSLVGRKISCPLYLVILGFSLYSAFYPYFLTFTQSTWGYGLALMGTAFFVGLTYAITLRLWEKEKEYLKGTYLYAIDLLGGALGNLVFPLLVLAGWDFFFLSFFLACVLGVFCLLLFLVFPRGL